jgi:hemolysin III
MKKLGNGYTLAEEIAHVVTHGIGAILSIAGLSWMLYLALEASDPWRIAAAIVYGSSLVVLFTASTLYHSFHSHSKRHVFEVLDQCAIYVLIAGSYTPFLLVSMRGGTGWLLFGAIWALATAGVITQLYCRDRFPRLVLASYLVMGWLVLLVLPQMIRAAGLPAFIWLLAGGLFYTVGVAFYVRKHVEYSHAIWHVFVLAGGVCHFVAVVLHVLPVTPVA